MSRTSLISRLISVAVLLALLVAAFPTAGAVAKGNTQGLEDKWSQLVDSYNRQSVSHNSAHQWADAWLMDNRNASASAKATIQRHINLCNSDMAAATAIVIKHEGFNANGEVVDKAAARTSVKQLSQALRDHAGSIRNLEVHVNH